MNAIASDLNSLLEFYYPKLKALSPGNFSEKISLEKWSKKEILGHLVDSAQNNLRRFIVSQYEDNPAISYKQDLWVNLNSYQNFDDQELIDLWYLQNRQIVNTLQNFSREMFDRTCLTNEIYPLSWLAEDYLKHLKHHMHVILDLEPIAYP